MRRCWAMLSGAYPPAPGGVSDYSRIVAQALTEAGDEAHVFTAAEEARTDGAVRVHGVPGATDGFSLAGLGALDDAIDRLPAHRQILVQYTPQAFAPAGPGRGSGREPARALGGGRGVNLLLPLWLLLRARRERRERITVMFHEVMHPIHRDQPWRHNILGIAHRMAARLLSRAAARVLVSTPRWGQILRDACGATCPIVWAPVPSNLPARVDPARVSALRTRLAADAGADAGASGPLIGHFGTYGPLIAPLLEPIVVGILRLDRLARVLLMGRGSAAQRLRMIEHHPAVAQRVIAVHESNAHTLAEHLAACDLVVQPYPDGVTTRRGSAMAALALGTAVVSNRGELNEDLWADSRAVELADSPAPAAMLASVGALLADAPRRRALGERGRTLYRERFAIEHTIRLLREGEG